MIVLDTHALVWWVSDSRRLSAKARRRISRELETSEICISSISAWEVAMLVRRARLQLSVDVSDWLSHVEQLDRFRFIPVDNRIAVRSTTLPEPFHKDPADRIIVATAQQLAAPVVTSDSKIQDYPHVETVW